MIALTNDEMKQLTNAANELAVKNASKVYLVGSCVEGRDPSDIDIVMVVSKARYTRMFQGTPEELQKLWIMGKHEGVWLYLTRFYIKQKTYLERFTHREVDFKVQTQEEFDKKTGPRLRLDSVIE